MKYTFYIRPIVVSVVALGMGGCFLFPSHHHLEVTHLAALTSGSESGFMLDPNHDSVYRSIEDSGRVTVLEECDLGRPTTPLTRTRRLFVGFKEVRLPSSSTIDIHGFTVQKTRILAALDHVPLAVFTYSLQAGGCAYDIVLWSVDESKGADNTQFMALSQQRLEALLPELVSNLTRE